MEELNLKAELRDELGRGKLGDLREKGFIPAVVYMQGKKSQPVKVSKSELLRLIHQHHIESAVISLQVVDNAKQKDRPCIIKEIQYHPVHGEIMHIDFNEISLTKAIKVNIAVVAKGEPQGVKQEGGSLEHILWEVEVECLPGDIPKNIEIDVANLKVGDAIHIKDLILPAKVKVLNDPDSIVLSVVSPMKEEAPAEAVEGEEIQEPEVIKEKKEEPAEGKEEEGQEKKEKEKK